MAKSKPIFITREAGPFTVKSSGGHLVIVGTGFEMRYQLSDGRGRVSIPLEAPEVLRQLAEALTEIADEQDAAKANKPAVKPSPKAKQAKKRPARKTAKVNPDEPTIGLSSDNAGWRLKGVLDKPTARKKPARKSKRR